MNSKEMAYRDALRDCIMAARLLTMHELPSLINDIEHADAVGPILNPTLWMQQEKKMHEDREVFEAALHLWKLGKKLLKSER